MSPRPAAPSLDDLLHLLWLHGGSDLLVTPGSPPLARIDGVLAPLDGLATLDPAATRVLVEARLPASLRERLGEQGSVDFSFSWGERARFRANAFSQRGSLAMAVRLIPYDIPDFDELGLPEVVDRLVELPYGLVLVTGPTGSGKSTTLAAMIDRINRERPVHVLTIEDPIEYLHRHGRAAVNQREIGTDAPTFELALRAALREDPDVLLIGEMRDLETIRTALTVAETGHLVFATLHTSDTTQAVDRIVDVFPAEQQDQVRLQLSTSLQAVLHQRLLPRIGGGRAAAFEVLLATAPVRNLIREGKTAQLRNQLIAAQRVGMRTLEASLSDLVVRGLVDHEEALARSVHPSEVLAKPAVRSAV